MAQANPAAAVANIYRTPELWEKITFTFICLVVYRIGSFVTVPGIDLQALTAQMGSKGGLIDLYNLFVGGNLAKSTVFALGIMPYISSSIFVQIAGAVVPQIEKMQKEEEGRKRVTEWTRYITVGLAIVQAYGFTLYVTSLTGVAPQTFAFKTEMVLFLTTGAIFVMWLGEQITERGLGNGASLIIFFSIIERMWPGIGDSINMMAVGDFKPLQAIAVIAVMVAVVAATVAITMAARRVMIQIPQRTMARGRMREASKNFIPLRVNAAGVMPIIFAQSLIVVPATIATFTRNPAAQHFAEYFNPPNLLYYVLSALLIVFFTYFYTSIIFNPIDLSENLKKQGGFIPGVKPGSKTADYIDYVVTRITLPGAIFLTFIALLPIFLMDALHAPFRFGGTSLLIVVGVALDTLAQVQQHLLLRKYDGFMKKGRVRFRGRQTAGGF